MHVLLILQGFVASYENIEPRSFRHFQQLAVFQPRIPHIAGRECFVVTKEWPQIVRNVLVAEDFFSRLQLMLVREGADFKDCIDRQRGEAGMGLFGRAAIFFIGQDDLWLDASAFDNGGPTSHFPLHNLDFFAISPFHDFRPCLSLNPSPYSPVSSKRQPNRSGQGPAELLLTHRSLHYQTPNQPVLFSRVQ
ncbi:MAG TPA: hypothetical protein VGG97_05780 [Bryobacteraceae bacterium]